MKKSKSILTLLPLILSFSFVLPAPQVKAKEQNQPVKKVSEENIKAHKAYEKQIKKMWDAGLKYDPTYQLEFAYHDFDKNGIDEVMLCSTCEATAFHTYEEFIGSYRNGKFVRLFGRDSEAAFYRDLMDYSYGSPYFERQEFYGNIYYHTFYKLEKGRVKELVKFEGPRPDNKGGSSFFKNEKKMSSEEVYLKELLKFRALTDKGEDFINYPATDKNLKKYRNTYNSKAFKAKPKKKKRKK